MHGLWFIWQRDSVSGLRPKQPARVPSSTLELCVTSFEMHLHGVFQWSTTDHTILLSRLDDWFGVTGKGLNWFKSYLTGRCQRIKLGDCLSSEADLKFGVPRGSVLSPLLFTLYTAPLSSRVFENAIPHHLYADDSQLYVSSASGESATALNGLQSCFASVQS